MTLSRRVAPTASRLLAMTGALGPRSQAPMGSEILRFVQNGRDAMRGTLDQATGHTGTGDGKRRGEEPPVKPAAPR